MIVTTTNVLNILTAQLSPFNSFKGKGQYYSVKQTVIRPQGLWLKENSEKFVLGKEIGAYITLRAAFRDI